MKIIGITYYNGEERIVLKGDSSLLNNKKPFFMPAEHMSLRATRCMVVRVSRLGKAIAPTFAYRYYDATAHGLNFWDETLLKEGKWTEGYCFDYSLCVGTFEMQGEMQDARCKMQNEMQDARCKMQNATPYGLCKMQDDWSLVVSIDEAIARVSRLMTIRQGDYIFIDRKEEPLCLVRNQIIEENGLYCKIK